MKIRFTAYLLILSYVFFTGCGNSDESGLEFMGGQSRPIEADFSVTETLLPEDQSLKFSDESTGRPTKWEWSFEGGTPSTSKEENPRVTFNNAGTFTVSLTVKNSRYSDEVIKEELITVYEPAKANFSVSKESVLKGSSVSFEDKSSGNPYQWEWVFEGGNPNTSTDQNPVVTYETVGTYRATLTASNENSSDKIIKENLITVFDKLEAGFTASETVVAEGSSISFTDNSTLDPDKWEWVFEGGDPNTSNQENPTVVYHNPGIYSVTLTASNDQTSNQIVEEDFITVLEKVEAGFSASETSIVEGNSITFTDESLNNPDSWEWVFEGGNPNTSTDQNPTVLFETPGVYNVSLIASNATSSDTEEKQNFVTVKEEVIALFDRADSIIDEGEQIQFTDISEGDPTTREWSFEGGIPAISTDPSPSVQFNSPGVYEVSLTVTRTSDSETDILTKEIVVLPTGGLVAFYPFDGDAVDNSGNGFDGMLNNGVTLAEDRNGQENNSFTFDGQDDYIRTSDQIDNNLNAGASFSSWIYIAEGGNASRILSNYNGTGAPGNCIERIGFVFGVTSSNQVNVFYAVDGDDYDGRVTSTNSLEVGKWYNVVATWEGAFNPASFKLYIDGVQSDVSNLVSGNNDCGGFLESDEDFLIGIGRCEVGFCAPFKGSIDEVRIYNRALSLNEIEALSKN
ncbi:PKD domain-containing protein [Marivirga tractuosa]|uniref:LamG domain-containing protein n=1 Tax=Marivirga tractuosa TaxID=1006 RepID=UPI0035CF3633